MRLCVRVCSCTSILLILSVSSSAKHSQSEDNADSSEEDVMDTYILGKNHNRTGSNKSRKNYNQDTVVEKFIDTLISSERYLSTMEKKLTHLDVTVHEKTNTIMKYLAELIRKVKSRPSQDVEIALRAVQQNLDKFKQTLIDRVKSLPSLHDAAEYGRSEPKTNSRLAAIENSMKSVQDGVDNIVSTISEVKNRQYTRERIKPLDTHPSLDTMAIVSEIRRTMHDQRSKKCDCKTGKVDRSERYPTDCNEIQMQGFNVSGIYKIKPDDYESFYVLCDLTTAGGGWTVLQNRMDGSQSFFKTWSDYKYGFGNLAGEFWMGLDKLHFLTTQKLYELRIEMETAQGHEAYAGYSVFSIGPEIEGYRISTLGTYYGTAGDSLSYHAGQKFSTPDMDNDEWKDGSCSVEHGGAWWYKECDKSNLNGNYILDGNEETKGKSTYWISFKGTSSPLAKTRMLIRPLPASRPSQTNDVSKKLLETVNGPLHGPSKTQAETKKASHQHYRYEDTLQNDPYF